MTAPHPTTRPTLPAIASVLAFTLLSAFGGWYILLHAGFHHQLNRWSKASVFVDGPEAALMAVIQFAMASLGAAWLLRLRLSPSAATLATGLIVVAPPALRVLLG